MFFSAPKNEPWRARLGADGFEDEAIDDGRNKRRLRKQQPLATVGPPVTVRKLT